MKKTILTITFILVIFISCKQDDNQDVEEPKTSIELVSENVLLGNSGEQLSDQIVIKIKKGSGEPYVGFPIDFIQHEVVEGAAFFASSSADSEGKIYINWTLGESFDVQTLTIRVIIHGEEAENSPITVTAIPQP